MAKKNKSPQLQFAFWDAISEQPREWESNVSILLKEIDNDNEVHKAQIHWRNNQIQRIL